MKITPIIIAFIMHVYSCSSTSAIENCKKCSIDIAINTINDSLNNKKMVKNLFCTAGESCLINAEFMEIFNEALFICLEKQPSTFIEQFSISSKQEFILKQLASPVNDNINPQNIITKFTQMPFRKTKNYYKILNALQMADKK